MPGIIVGVDGSGDSHLALEWAVKEAVLQHAPLTVLTVHQIVAGHLTGTPVVYPADTPLLKQATEAADEAVAKAESNTGMKPESVTVKAINGRAAEELINASHDADLLVVGSRGAGGFASLLMGSVSSQVVSHAKCPVVVIRHHR